MLTAEQIIDVLDLSSPRSRDPVVAQEQKRIERRAAEIRRDMPFSAWRLARVEWLEAQMKDWGKEMSDSCAECGMNAGPAYHSFAACVMFQHLRNSLLVEANIKAVVEYGMKAERRGVSLDDALRDIATVIK